MSRPFRVAVFIWCAFWLAVGCSVISTTTAPAKSVTARAWAPLPSQAFLPIPPLLRPIRPVATATPRPSESHLATSDVTPVAPRAPRIIHPTSSSSGVATFYAYHGGQAAAAKRLRDAIGPGWRGTVVHVWYAGRPPLTLVLTDSESSKIPGRLIDLDEADFATLAGPGWYQRGVLPVKVTW